ncbi:MAG: methyl-accepting chemotaxis protein [Oscillospiraceae bacterium]|nr:methyl-accepting chemotaxis protein [Oscillospiraceae bacterium]
MKNLRVSAKLTISFMIVIVFAIAVGVIGMYGMYSINAAEDALYHENIVAISALGAIREVVQDQRVHLYNMVINAGDADQIRALQISLEGLEMELADQIEIYKDTIVDENEESHFRAATQAYNTVFAELKRNVREASLVSFEAGLAAVNAPGAAQAVNTMVTGFDTAMRNNDQWALDSVNENTALFRTMLTIQIILLVAAVAVALFFTFYISNIISKPLGLLSAFMNKAGATGAIELSPDEEKNITEMGQYKDEIGVAIKSTASFVSHVTHISEKLKTIASGDLSVQIKLLSNEDTMGLSMRHMLLNLNDMFANIQRSTAQVSMGSKQVADGAQSLAQGATEQASSIQQLSASITEIASSTKANALTAEKTAKLSQTIMDKAEKGSHQMDEMITAVKDINEASQSISKIIKTIDDIAFQTNILALNAAVEAARAGQHGKGFAVVAEEVRNLASKSAEAAKDTGNMIQNSMEKAELGSRIASETAISLKEIVEGIHESTQLVSEIANASESQSEGISQINVGIDQVAQVVQQNSATAEQSAAASEEMSSQSTMLEELILKFKLT